MRMDGDLASTSDPEGPIDWLRCLEHGPDCDGPVEMRLNARTWNSFPRCEHHWEKRLQVQKRIDHVYPDEAQPPEWFDPAAAGEQWDED